jgi:hypothetical protein
MLVSGVSLLSDGSRTAGQVAKDKNPSPVVEKNLVMSEIQNLSTWLSKNRMALARPNAQCPPRPIAQTATQRHILAGSGIDPMS